MQMKQVGALRRSAQAGFTLIELIVVIVILGILAATALPKFASLGADARISKMNGAAAAMRAAASMYHGKWLAGGSKVGGDTFDTTIVVNGTGFPNAASIAEAAGGLNDYKTVAAGSYAADANHLDCLVVYDAAAGTVATTGLNEANCD